MSDFENAMLNLTDSESELERELARLLADMFANDELYTFLRLQVDKKLVNDLPPEESLSRNQYAARAAEKLVERGLVTSEFFTVWSVERCHRSADIAELAARVQQATRPPPTDPDPDVAPEDPVPPGNLFIEKPLFAPAMVIVYSLVLLTMSHRLGLNRVTDIHDGILKQTGYTDAPSWSIGLGVIAPLCLYFLLSAIRRVMELPMKMARRGMVVEERGGVLVPLPPDVAAARLYRRGMAGWKEYRMIFHCFVCLSLLFGGWYWWESCMSSEGLVIKGFLAREPVFGLFAVAMLVLVLVMIFGYLCVVYALLSTARDLIDVDKVQAEYLVPDFESSQERGFEIFGRTIIDLILVLSCLLFMAYLARLWSVFFHDSSQETFYQFVIYDLPTMFWQLHASDLLSVLVIFGSIIGVIFGVKIPLSQLGEIKQIVKERLPGRELANRRPEDVKVYLDEMYYWPMHFPGNRTLIALATLTCLGIIFSWLGLLTLAILDIVIVIHIRRRR